MKARWLLLSLAAAVLLLALVLVLRESGALELAREEVASPSARAWWSSWTTSREPMAGRI